VELGRRYCQRDAVLDRPPGRDAERTRLAYERCCAEAPGILDRRFPSVADAGDDQDFRKPSGGALAHVLLEHAKAAGERDLPLGVALVAEEHDFVLEERPGQARKGVIGERRGSIRDLGAQVPAGRMTLKS
jgi:hypothetical protein